MCDQDCQTFLWGGGGISTVGADGGCRCACGDETWSEYSILGLPSCVPSKAHVVFGAVGVLMATTTLGHSAYQLYRQVGGHSQEGPIPQGMNTHMNADHEKDIVGPPQVPRRRWAMVDCSFLLVPRTTVPPLFVRHTYRSIKKDSPTEIIVLEGGV